MSVQQSFDSAAYKKTTRSQWETAAEPWHRWADLLTSWLGPATTRMLDMAEIGSGSHVLDVAAGAGDQTIAVGQRVGTEGRVLATDISPTILEFAAERARTAGLANIETRELDGERLTDLPGGSFDAVISRVGMIYFPDRQKALAGMHHALRDGGRVAAWCTPVRIATSSFRFRCRSSGGAPICPRRHPVSRVRSVWAAMVCWPRPSSEPASAISLSRSSTRHSVSIPPRSVCASRRSPLARCIRCFQGSVRMHRRRRGRRSKKPWVSLNHRMVDSRARANWSSPPE